MFIKSTTIARAFAIASLCFTASTVYADHWPEKRVIATQKVYANLPTKNTFQKAGTVNFEEYGARPAELPTKVDNPVLEKMLGKPSNIAALVQKNGNLIFERYHPYINSNQPIWATSMAKTATATAVGKLICTGKIQSIDDELGKYSSLLADTVYANVTIRNALQMRSGVSENRDDENTIANKAKGILDQQDFGTAKQALATYKKPYAEQGKRFSYHVSDTLALSLLVEEVAGESLGSFFYNNIMKMAAEKPYMIWVTDRNGSTVGFGDLVMPARDWLKLGSYVMQEMVAETCLGKFFDEGMKTAVTTEYEYKKYGYQSWVYASSSGPMLAFHGHFGNIMVLDKERNTVMLLLSLNGNYGNYQILGDAGKIMDRLATLTE